MNLVIVESPAKAKTINKYLGNEFNVLASFGHVRDLPSKNGSVDPENDFSFEWEVSNTSKKHIKEIYEAAESSSVPMPNVCGGGSVSRANTFVGRSRTMAFPSGCPCVR